MITQKEIRDKIKYFTNQKFDDGSRIIVPVIGSGFSREIEQNKAESWAGLLKSLEDKYFDESFNPPQSFTSRWESLVIKNSKSTKNGNEQLSAKEAEKELTSEIVKTLKNWESKYTRPNFSIKSDQYKKFLEAKFKDIISLNFDRRLAICGHDGEMPLIKTHSNFKTGSRTALYRHDLIKNNSIKSRIWYPHGDTSYKDTIKLGIADYGRYIDNIIDEYNHIKKLGHDSRHNTEVNQQDEKLNDYKKYTKNSSWVFIALNRPLLFIGVGLSYDEWPLWWLLHQHARNKARINGQDKNPVFVLTFDGIPKHLKNNPAGIQVANFSDANDLWNFVWKTFS